MRQRFPSMLLMQLGILQKLLNSSAIRSHSSEVGTAKYIYIYIYIYIYVLDTVLSKCLLSYFFQLENSNPKTQMIP